MSGDPLHEALDAFDAADARSVVTIGPETETDSGWRYAVSIDRPDGRRTSHGVSLSWVDHDHLAGGAAPPSAVTRAVVEALAEVIGDRPLPERFDVSTVRRMVPDLPERMRFGGTG
jgi:hypothetical protein